MITNYQYIVTCLAFSKGKPFRKSFYTNALYTVSVVALVLFSGVIVMAPLNPTGWLYWDFLNMLPCPAWYRFGYITTGIVLNTIVTFSVEYFFIATCV